MLMVLNLGNRTYEKNDSFSNKQDIWDLTLPKEGSYSQKRIYEGFRLMTKAHLGGWRIELRIYRKPVQIAGGGGAVTSSCCLVQLTVDKHSLIYTDWYIPDLLLSEHLGLNT